MKKNKSGFTLIEVLIVAMILSIISLAIFSTFSNGLKIYNRINSEATVEDLVIFCDRFGTDLRNSLNFNGINFTGKEEELEFAGIFNSPRMQRTTIGRVKYAFNPSSGRIDRYVSDYSTVYSQEGESLRHSLDKVKSCVFSYYYFDNLTNGFAWGPGWDKQSLPVAVRMELEFKDDPRTKFTRSFNIPAGDRVRNETGKQ
jgi:prepilin-type N-terminal cleavage/methylation domain-containing protein